MCSMSFDDLSSEERCVIANAIDEGDLRSLLNSWDPTWTEEVLDRHRSRLGQAVLRLASLGIIEAYLSGSPPDALPLDLRNLEVVVRNPKAWWNEDEGLEVVVWLALTEAGQSLLAKASVDQLYQYRRRVG
jgi:hypothetical protein